MKLILKLTFLAQQRRSHVKKKIETLIDNWGFNSKMKLQLLIKTSIKKWNLNWQLGFSSKIKSQLPIEALVQKLNPQLATVTLV